MADYKVVDAEQLDADLKSLADSIRSKSRTSGILSFPNGLKSTIDNIQAVINGTNPTTLTTNETHVTGGYSHVKVDVPPPEGYVKFADMILRCDESDNGTFLGSGQTPEQLSIQCDFRPRVMMVFATSAITTSNTASPYDIAFIIRVSNSSATLRDACTMVYKSGSNAKSGHTQSSGLRGNADYTLTGWGTNSRFASGVTYTWYAWGNK